MFQRFIILFCALLMLPLYGSVPQGTDLSQLNAGSSERSYRKRSFCAYKPLQVLEKELKVGRYSSYENPTGIFFEEGETIRLNLHNQPAEEVKLIIHDFLEGGQQDTYPLQKGENQIQVKHKGLGYIDYRSPKGNKAPKITVTIRGGTINGIFSHHDNAATWKRLLAKLPAGVLDMVGERCQVVFHAEGLRQAVPKEGPEMLALYDRIVEIQQKLMGWDQEGIHPGNHMMCRVIWQGFMHADGLGAAFHRDTIAGISEPGSLRRAAWGVAHELGHVNQTRPGFCWAGIAEVSNNIFSAWTNYLLYPKDARLEHEGGPSVEGEGIRGARFDNYINSALVKKQLWQFQAGPDSGVDKVPGKHTGDHFVSVCPLWQLQLYFHVARGNEDFYPDIFRAVRAFDDKDVPHGQLRVNLCRYICEAAKLNMGEFLVHTGMLAVMNRCVEDYSSHMVTITRSMVEDTLKAAAKFPEPDSSVIYYINVNNVEIYRDRLPVEPSSFVPVVPANGGKVVFRAKDWKNAVAFEVYKGKELVRVCLRGLGQEDNASTTVICPPGTTAIQAVQWDGERFPVRIKRGK